MSVETSVEISDVNAEESVDSNESDTVLCILLRNGKMAAAYYKINERMLYTINELVDLQPEYEVTRALVREIQPRHILTLGSICDAFVKTLIDIITNQDAHTTMDSDQIRTIPSNMSLLSFNEYPGTSCEYRVKSLQLASEPENTTDEEREIYLHSLINFQSKMSIYALGILIKFLEKSWVHLNNNSDTLCFMHLQQTSLHDHVYIDKTTFNALQIFRKIKHDANFKHGGISSSREGISLFKLFSQHCRSKVGYFKMRNLMMTPTKNVKELNKRLNFIEFVLDSRNRGLAETLMENMRNIGDVNSILVKIQYSKGSARDWESLYKTIYHILFLNESSAPYINDCPFLLELANSVTKTLYGLETCIDNAFDFKKSIKTNRLVIKEGLDAYLDENKLLRENINKNVSAAAKIVLDQLPGFLDECTVFYIPDMGHVVALKRWEENCDHNELINFGFQFMFLTRKIRLYVESKTL